MTWISSSGAYIEMSLGHAEVFHTKSNAVGLVVSPGAWIFHKALTFVKRKAKAKAAKDLYGIWYVASQLGQLSKRAVSEFHTLAKEQASWATRARKQLQDWVQEAAPADWERLESQDPSGTLSRQRFVTVVSAEFD